MASLQLNFVVVTKEDVSVFSLDTLVTPRPSPIPLKTAGNPLPSHIPPLLESVPSPIPITS